MAWTFVPVTVVINPASTTPPPTPQTITSFTASQTAITQGQSVTLTWGTSNATAVLLNGASVAPSGTQVVTPTTTTTYTLEADGAAAPITQLITVNVTAPVAHGTVAMIGTNVINDLDPDPSRTMVEAGYMGQAGVVSNGGDAFAPNFGSNGGLVLGGGGHGDYGGNEIYGFDFAQNKWIRLSNPSLSATSTTDPNIDRVHGELPDGSAMAWHGFNTMFVAPGGTNGKGLLCRISGTSLGIGDGGTSSPWVHAADLGVTPIADPTAIWQRYSLNACNLMGSSIPSPSFHCYDVAAGRIWGGYAGGFHSSLCYFDLATRMYTMVAGVASSNWGYMPNACAHPVHGIMLWVAGFGGYNKPQTLQLMGLDLSNPTQGAVTLKMAGDLIPTSGLSVLGGYAFPMGIDWDTTNDVGYICCGDDDRNNVYKVTCPADPINGTWQLTKTPLASPLAQLAPLDAVYGHWRYCPSIKAFTLVTTTHQQLCTWTP